MLACAGRLLAVPLVVLAGTMLWSHLAAERTPPGASPTPGAVTHHQRAHGSPRAGAAIEASPSSSPSTDPANAGGLGSLPSGLWRVLNDDIRGTATGEQAILRELSGAIRGQVERLLRSGGGRTQ